LEVAKQTALRASLHFLLAKVKLNQSQKSYLTQLMHRKIEKASGRTDSMSANICRVD
jgi:hypothetical protein